MLAGFLGALGRCAGATRGLTKIALGLNPNQPFELRGWLSQFSLGGGGGVGAAQASHGSSSIMDQMASRSAPQQARQPPPQR